MTRSDYRDCHGRKDVTTAFALRKRRHFRRVADPVEGSVVRIYST